MSPHNGISDNGIGTNLRHVDSLPKHNEKTTKIKKIPLIVTNVPSKQKLHVAHGYTFYHFTYIVEAGMSY